MATLKDAPSEALRQLTGNRSFVSGLLAISAGTASRFKTVTNTIIYCIDGVFCSFAPNDTASMVFSAGSTATVPIGSTGYWLIALDSAGAVTTYQSILTAAEVAAGVNRIPDVPSNVCVIGGIKIVCASAAFVPNTSDLSLSGTTDTYTNFSCAPSRLSSFA